jgi:hypothetical protein
MLSTLLEELQRRRVGWLSAFCNTPMWSRHDFGPLSHDHVAGGRAGSRRSCLFRDVRHALDPVGGVAEERAVHIVTSSSGGTDMIPAHLSHDHG